MSCGEMYFTLAPGGTVAGLHCACQEWLARIGPDETLTFDKLLLHVCRHLGVAYTLDRIGHNSIESCINLRPDFGGLVVDCSCGGAVPLAGKALTLSAVLEWGLGHITT